MSSHSSINNTSTKPKVAKKSKFPADGKSGDTDTKQHTDQPWDEVLYHLIIKSRPISQDFCHAIVDFCRQWCISYINHAEVEKYIDSEAISAKKQQKVLLKIAFEQSLNIVREQQRDNIIDIKYNKQKYIKLKEFMENIQSMCRLPNEERDTFADEQLLQLFMALESPNDVLLIMDIISRVESEAVKYGEYNVIHDKDFIKACNEYIRSNIPHYDYDGKAFTDFIQALSVIRRSRFLNPIRYLQKIKEIDQDDSKGSNVIDYNIQPQIYSVVCSFLKCVSKQAKLKNCSVVCDILSFCRYEPQNMDTNLENIFESVEFAKNMRAENMAYISMKENGDINVEYIGRSESEIGISISDTKYKQFYSDSHWFHVMRGNRKCLNQTERIALGMYKFGDRIKLYWHDDGSVLPLALKDPFCGKWLKLRFNSDMNALNESYFYNTIQPYLQRHRLLNHYLDHKLYSTFSALIERLAIHNSKYQKIFVNFKNELDTDRIESEECTELSTYRSKYGENIKLELSDAQTMQLSLIISEPFYDTQERVNEYISKAIMAQISNNEMTVFRHSNQEKAIVCLGVHNKYFGEELFGILKRYYGGHTWVFDEHRTKTEILTQYYGLNKLPKLYKEYFENSKPEKVSENMNDMNFAYLHQTIFESGLINPQNYGLFMKNTPLPLTFVSMQINVIDLAHASESIHLTVQIHDTIHSIKQKIENRKGYPTNKLILLMLDRVLSNDKTLYDYNIQSNDNLFLMFRFGDSNQVQSPNRESDEKDNDSDSENDGKDEEKQINISNAENIDETAQQNIDEQKESTTQSENSESGSFSLESRTPQQVQSDWSSAGDNSLPVRILTEKDIGNLKRAECGICAICKIGFKTNEEVKRMPCLHEYHSGCIDQWLEVKRVCPVCMTQIFR